MNPRKRSFLLLTGAILLSGGLALLSGCKGNPSAAADIERRTSAPPVVMAYPASGDPKEGDPLVNAVWKSAAWTPLVAPANTDRTTASVSAAVLYDANELYVAFVISRSNPAFRGVNGVAPIAQDMVSVYLDSSKLGNGAEILQVTVNSKGLTTCAWVRDAEPPAQPKADGSPDVFHPVSRIMDVTVAGLYSKTMEGTSNGESVWTAVVGIPLKGVPVPLRASPAAGTNWKLNLIRTTVLADNGSGTRQLQANLSPVYVGQQAVSPYRMSDLRLVGAQVSSLVGVGGVFKSP